MLNKIKKISHGKLEPVFYFMYQYLIKLELTYFKIRWFLKGYRRPKKEEVNFVVENVTFIYKSFERQRMAKRLYHNIQSYYPGVKVIIADDSSRPLDLKGESLTIVQLPFNSGLSYGLNRALEKVETPFLMRMDDDELLTPLTKVENELQFLYEHPEIDLVGFGVMSTPKCESPLRSSYLYYNQPMNEAPKPLKIPHMTGIDEKHVVVGKSPNIFLARTDKIKEIGWDDNIRMIDHNEFFMRAAGNIVCVLNPTTIVFHYHNQFNTYYQEFRGDVQRDRAYIYQKHYLRNKF